LRVLVLFAHPVETSFQSAIHGKVLEGLKAAGHEVDDCDLYAEGFNPVMSREERLNYHDEEVCTKPVQAYVDRVRAAEGLVLNFPVWNYGYPAILKGFFDRIFLPGVSFVLIGGDGADKGKLVPNMKNIKKVAYVTTYGGDRFRTWIMGDPPRRLAMRWAWVTFGTLMPPKYLALYDMNNQTQAGLTGFIDKVKRAMERF
jgi:NAD(P)H dehydrogenase (quinone)